MIDFDRWLFLTATEAEAVVYRVYGAGVLLYVGQTTRLRKRLQAHANASAWWWQVDRVEVEGPMGLGIAELTERIRIRALAPLYNRAWNRRRGWDYGRGPGLRYDAGRDEFHAKVAA